MITGTDDISLKILERYTAGDSIKSIVSGFGVTVDQAKKLSRYNNLLQSAEGNIVPALLYRLKALGIKVLVLSDMFKSNDWNGIAEILNSVDIHIKRDVLAKYPAMIAEKCKRIAKNKSELEYFIDSLESQQKEMQQKIADTERNYADMQSNLAQLKKYPKDIIEFLSAHVGLADGRPCLTRRVHQDWHKSLKKSGLLVYSEEDYIYYIPQLSEFADEALRRSKTKGKLVFNEDKNVWGDSVHYRSRGIVRVSDNLIERAEVLKQEIINLAKEKKRCEKEIRELRHKTPESFLETVIASNQLSARDMKTHGELQDFGLRWLYKNDYACITELVLDNMRFDVFGFNPNQKITVIEAKASFEDFSRDNKWQKYLRYCDEFYFIFEDLTYNAWQREIDNKISGAGVIIQGSYDVVKPRTLNNGPDDDTRRMLIFRMGQTLSKKFIFGH